MQIEKTKDGRMYKYRLIKNGEELAYIKGGLLNEQMTLSLRKFHAADSQQEKLFAQKIGKAFFEDCLKNESTIIVWVSEAIKKAEWFLKENKFTHKFTRYVFENDLKALETPSHTFELKSLEEVDLLDYQKIYYECSKGDPEVDLTGLTYTQFYEKDKKETGDLWDDHLLHMVFLETEPVGVLNLRTEIHQKAKIQEGSINYIGLLPTHRKRGLGTDLHLTGLHQLKKLGCENYFGGTSTLNKAMMATFRKNNCIITSTEHYYKAES